MATVTEMMMQDAAASIETSYTMAVGDTFNGNLDGSSDADWVAVELEAGTTYSISLTGVDDADGEGGADDTVLMLLDAKGGMIAMNDDINSVGSEDNPANLNSRLTFMAEADGTYYIAASSYNRIPGSDNSGDYAVSVMALDLPADIEGTDANEKLTGTDGAESIAGGAGDDTINGMGGDDELDGGAGNDLITGGPGADMIKGGDDMDTIAYGYSPMGVSINLRAGTASGGDADGDELVDDIENVQGSMYDDTLSGSRGDNMLWGLGGNDDLFGDKGEDDLFGGAGDDNLDGGDGDDTLEGGYGADTLTGGEDDDTASYAGSMMGVTVRLHSSTAMGGDAKGDVWGDTVTVEYTLPDEDGMDVEYEETVPDIVNLTGSNMADILAGDSRANTIMGLGGDDKLYGGPGGGDDMLHGGRGDDMIFGGIGADFLHGNAGDDMLNGGPGADEFYGGAGSDMIYADAMDIANGVINGWLDGQGDDETTDDVDEGMESDMDPMTADTVSFARLENGVEFSLDTDADFVENVIGTDDDDTLTGEDGVPNVINGLDGADVLSGGTGTDPGDTVSYEHSDRGVTVTVDGDGVTSPSGGHAQGDTITNFENATGSAHDDNLTGDAGANVLKGLGGDDEIEGLGGSDTIEGGAGGDELDGGTSDASTQSDTDDGADTEPDTLSYASSDAAVQVNLASLTFTGGHAEGDEIEAERDAYDPDGPEMEDGTGDMDPVDVASFENVRGSDHNDRLTGDHRMNTLMGGDGDDTLSGGGEFDMLMGQKGDDTISGGAGSDHLVGGPGADRLDGGEVRGERDNMIANEEFDDGEAEGLNNMRRIQTTELDWAVYRPAEEGVEVNLSTNRGTGGDAMGDRLTGIEVVWGSKNDDTFIASADEDTHDIIHGDSGADTVSYEASETPVMVDLGDDNDNGQHAAVTGDGSPGNPFVFTYTPSGDTPTLEDVDTEGVAGDPAANGAAGDRLGGIENLTGSDHNDTLEGDGNPNVLKGGGGNDDLDGEGNVDKLYGGAGRDSLDGGAGNDMLNGGAGDDELTGGDDNDTFVFAPGDGDDVINDFNTGENMIDLTAFDLDADDLAGLMRTRGEGAANVRVIIDLSDHGGGTIELVGVDDIDDLDALDPADGTNDMFDLGTDAEGDVDTGVFII